MFPYNYQYSTISKAYTKIKTDNDYEKDTLERNCLMLIVKKNVVHILTVTKYIIQNFMSRFPHLPINWTEVIGLDHITGMKLSLSFWNAKKYMYPL